MPSDSTIKGPKIQRLPRSSFLPGLMPPKPENPTSADRASETKIAPRRAGDWKNATQSPRPNPNAANDRPNKTKVLSSENTTQISRRAPVMSTLLRGQLALRVAFEIHHAKTLPPNQ